MKKTTHRLTLDVSPAFYARLSALEELVGAVSKAQTIRSAIRLYEWVARRHAAGERLQAVDAAGRAETFALVGLLQPSAETPRPAVVKCFVCSADVSADIAAGTRRAADFYQGGPVPPGWTGSREMKTVCRGCFDAYGALWTPEGVDAEGLAAWRARGGGDPVVASVTIINTEGLFRAVCNDCGEYFADESECAVRESVPAHLATAHGVHHGGVARG